MNVAISITTFNRPEHLCALISDFFRFPTTHNYDIVIVDDHSSVDYSNVFSKLKNLNKLPNFEVHFFRNDENFGKANYWRSIHFTYQFLKTLKFDRYIMLPDDVRLCPGFVTNALDSYNTLLRDKKKLLLNLLVDHRFRSGMWGSNSVATSKHGFYDTDWTDLCFITNSSFFDALNYSIEPILNKHNRRSSSGVGAQITRRLRNEKFSMLHPDNSFVSHGDHDSVMHPELRKDEPLIASFKREKVIASLATIKCRRKSLRQTVEHLIPQVDKLYIYANDYMPRESFYHNNDKIIVHNEYGDIGDVGKFVVPDNFKGYHFTCDDDLIYPNDYVLKSIVNIEKYKRKAVISYHGRRWFNAKKIENYYNNNNCKAYSCLKQAIAASKIHIPGTGVMAYHTDTVRFPLSLFKQTNMSDIFAGIHLNDKEIDTWMESHSNGWITEADYDREATIWAVHHKDCSFQTDLVNNTNWRKL